MKIHSSFHDYYDKMLSLGQDPKIHYVRKTEDFWVDSSSLYCNVQGRAIFENRRYVVGFDLEIVGFCGELIPLVRVRCSLEDSKDKRLYDVDSVQGYMGEGEVPETIVVWLKECRVNDYFRSSPLNHKDLFEIFSKYKAPVFHAKEEGNGIRFTVNPCLRELEFFRKYPAFEAWQKLSHYVGNVLLEESKPVWPVPDKITAESHGFDKYSFRKDKQKS